MSSSNILAAVLLIAIAIVTGIQSRPADSKGDNVHVHHYKIPGGSAETVVKTSNVVVGSGNAAGSIRHKKNTDVGIGGKKGQGCTGLINDVANGASDVLSGVVNTVGNAVSDLTHHGTVLGGVGATVDTVGGVAQSALDDVLGGLNGALDDTGCGLKHAVKDALSGITHGHLLKGVGSAVDDLGNGVENVGEDVVGAVGHVLGGTVDKVGNLLHHIL